MTYVVIGSLSCEDQIEKVVKSNADNNCLFRPAPRSHMTFEEIVCECFYAICHADVVFVVPKSDGTLGKGTTYELVYAKMCNKDVIHIPPVDQS